MEFIAALDSIATGQYKLFSSTKNYCTYKVGGIAKYIISPQSLKCLSDVTELLKEYKIKYIVIGNGSNLLFSDKIYDGAIICTKNLRGVFCGANGTHVMCGTKLPELYDYCLAHSFGGTETLCDIPATVGGAVAMNAGAFGYSVSDYVNTVTVLENGKQVKYYKDECKFGYRKSRFLRDGSTIISVDFDFPYFAKTEIEKLRNKCLKSRLKTQPKGCCCGSVFKNPEGEYAARLIEKCGLKGVKHGGAVISSKHANFIINKKDASSDDIFFLIKLIKHSVFDKFGIELKEEVKYVGEFDDT